MNDADEKFTHAIDDFLISLLSLDDANISPGAILGHVRGCLGIGQTDLAAALKTSVKHIDDIEHDHAPFPTMLMMLLFVHGLPGWYYGTDKTDM